MTAMEDLVSIPEAARQLGITTEEAYDLVFGRSFAASKANPAVGWSLTRPSASGASNIRCRPERSRTQEHARAGRPGQLG